MNDATAEVQVDSFQKKFRSVRAEIARDATHFERQDEC